MARTPDLGVTGQGGAFSLDAYADRALDLPLPGGDKHWPQGAQLDGKPAVVVEKDGRPVVRLTAGGHRVDGRFTWDRLPDSLAVPAAVAIVDLTVEGRAVALPRREADGLLLLRQAGAAGAGGENLQLKVFRQVTDGIPLWVETRIVFEVSGRAREVPLAGALPDGAAPVAVGGDLPARLDPDGRLRVQVRAGTFTVRVLARLSGRPETLALPKTAAPWPPQEVWVFTAVERLRQVELGGAPPIDPSRTDLPEEWRRFPAFLMEGEAKLALKEVRRGEPDASPDRVSLSRRLWLDEAGGSLTVRDTFSGQLGRTSRLDLLAPAELGRVAIDGAGQLITSDPVSGEPGVEVRKAALRLEADSRTKRQWTLPAVGWAVNVQSLRADLQLPPGWRLLGATGVDQVPGSWLGRWNLFGFFFVLLTALAVGKLFGRQWALLALLTLVLLHGEAGAPRLVWLFLIAALAVANVAPEGLLRTLARIAWGAGLMVLVLTLVPFFIDQIRRGLFPHAVEAGAGFGEPQMALAGGMLQRAAPPAAPAPSEAPEMEQNKREDAFRPKGAEDKAPAKQGRYELNVLSPNARFATKAYEQDPHAVIQTGAGVPSWSWASYPLIWSGPVAKEQRMRLLLLSPAANLVLALLRVALATLLALRLVEGAVPGLAGRLRPGPPAAAALVLLAALGLASHAAAQEEDKRPPRGGGLYPSPQLLEDLKQRLTRAPACAPHCVSTGRLHLALDGGELRFEAEVHAGATGAWPIPGPAQSWVPRTVSLDGKPAEGSLARLQDGFLYVHVAPGLHQVAVAGPLPGADSLTLQFREKPRRASASAPGWQVDGIREDGSADDSVQLSRKLASGAVASASGGGGYEPWLEVTRVLDLGVSWGVETVVRRISPAGAPVVVKVPLLKGMLVTDPEHQVKDGEVLVTLGRDQMEARWSATLPPAEGQAVTLKAPEGKPWSEVWIVNCGLAWECEAKGLPPVARLQDGRLAPEFRPLPGESLSLMFRKPKGALGQTLTIDKASLLLVPGIRLEDATLDLHVRASRPGPLALTLPPGAEVQELKVKGSDRPVRPDGDKLSVTIDAGDQPVHVVWRRSGGLGIAHRAPAVALSQPAVNVQVSMQLPEERWLLVTGGPSWGPHVLFWGYLLFVLLAASVLARVPLSPLRTWEWLLLALGLTQIPVFGALAVAGWFLILAWRRDRVLEGQVQHNLLQLTLVLWTFLALVYLYTAIRHGLLLRPDMQVAGGDSSETLLQWYRDRIDGPLPRPWVLSLPLWFYKSLMLLWSLWLALGLIRWLPWAWGSFSSGSLWWSKPKKQPPTGPPPSEPPPAGAPA